ncbi:MAG: DMT family transporter [Anaerolineae bacterium]|nr:DMT family transporter [Anaerolineae bacterium]
MSTSATLINHKERIEADLILLTVALIWGSGFVAQRVAAAHLTPLMYNGTRFLLGALVILPLTVRRLRQVTRAEWRGGMLAGLLLFGASFLQQAGLRFTTAGKAGFITGLYVVLVPLLLALVWRRWPRPSAWIASLLATGGLFLLSSPGRLALAPGDGWIVACAVVWAFHVILIGLLAPGTEPLRLALVQFTVCGVLSLGLALILGRDSVEGLVAAGGAIVYSGIASVGLGFSLQVVGQRLAPPTDAAVILSLESVSAALFGWLLLGEQLTSLQLLGCGLMLLGMLVAQLRPATSGERLYVAQATGRPAQPVEEGY